MRLPYTLLDSEGKAVQGTPGPGTYVIKGLFERSTEVAKTRPLTTTFGNRFKSGWSVIESMAWHCIALHCNQSDAVR